MALARARASPSAEVTAPHDGSLLSPRVQLRLAADGRSDLAPLLARLKGYRLPGGFALGEPLGVGGQGIVWSARDSKGSSVAVKVPLLDYHRPWSYGQAEIRRARAILEHEAEMLRRVTADLRVFPSFVACVAAPNPLHEPVRDRSRVGLEPFLVLERIEGTPLLLHAKQLLQQRDSGHEQLAPLLRAVALEMLATEQLLEARGALYVDFKPEHLLVETRGQVRLLDAGGIYVLGSRGGEPLAITPRYAGKLPYSAEGHQRAATAARCSLARTLYEIWTGRPAPLQGALSFAQSEAGAPGWLAALAERLEASTPAAWIELIALVDLQDMAEGP